MITATEKASQKFKEVLAKQNNPRNIMLRIDYSGAG